MSVNKIVFIFIILFYSSCDYIFSVLPPKYLKQIKFEESENLDAVLDTVDVLYVTRVQKERFASEAEYLKLKGSYVVDKASLSKMKKDAIIMHPLPRIDEIAPEVDSDPRAAYFRQAKNGLYMRMALLQELLAKN